MKLKHSDPRTLIERADLEDKLAEKAARAAHNADVGGRTALANSLWRLVRRSRARGLMLRGFAAAASLRHWWPKEIR